MHCHATRVIEETHSRRCQTPTQSPTRRRSRLADTVADQSPVPSLRELSRNQYVFTTIVRHVLIYLVSNYVALILQAEMDNLLQLITAEDLACWIVRSVQYQSLRPPLDCPLELIEVIMPFSVPFPNRYVFGLERKYGALRRITEMNPTGFPSANFEIECHYRVIHTHSSWYGSKMTTLIERSVATRKFTLDSVPVVWFATRSQSRCHGLSCP